MVGIQRVLEGTDWPVCSAVYCVGMPGSLNMVVQLLGRAMRPKGADYPAGQRDRAYTWTASAYLLLAGEAENRRAR